MAVADMTHDEIADWAAMRIRRTGFPMAFSNMTSATCGEQPDVLGMDAWANSILIEVKVSRADFFADQKKPWRKEGAGMGKTRVYLTPKDLLKPEEIPYGWELWEVHGKNKPILKIIKGLNKSGEWTKHHFVNTDSEEMNHFSRQDRNCIHEAMWCLKILKRMKMADYPVEDFANGAKLKAIKGWGSLLGQDTKGEVN